ncbi:MAG: DUF1800 family protein, partial [Pseudomonadota bacterium]
MAADADPDGDKIPNVLEHWLCLDPTVFNSLDQTFQYVNDGGSPRLRLVQDTSEKDSTFAIIGSANLQDWFSIEIMPEWVTNTGATRTYDIPLGAQGARFFRAVSEYSPRTTQQDGLITITLTDTLQSDSVLRLEYAADPNNPVWKTLARSYDDAWELASFEPVVFVPGTNGNPDQIIINASELPLLQFRYSTKEPVSRTAAEAASRFLQQASFGPKLSEINALAGSNNDFGTWIDNQLSLPATRHTGLWQSMSFDSGVGGNTFKTGIYWCHAAIDGQDQLRQRMAWALAQIFVIGKNSLGQDQYPERWVKYYDIMVDNAFGNFRDLLQAVTLSPMMGDYLTYVNNRKAIGATQPDENYAREVMQLFSIGLWQLNQDGTLMLDPQGNPIPTYTNSHIETHARVFTGLIYAPDRPQDANLPSKRNRVDPMQ